MKKLIISFILSIMAVVAMAQTNYYPNASGVISKSGYTYKYRNGIIADVEAPSTIDLYNASTAYLDMKWQHKDGTPLTAREAQGAERDPYYFSYSSMNYDQLRSLVAGYFTSQQKATLGAKGNSMIITARINPDTGKVADVYFFWSRNELFMNIPVETFRSIELAIKQRLTITSTAAGRRFNYCEFIWEQKF